MARPKEFERQQALEAAIKVFANRGFGGTSTAALLQAMEISRQSLYDTFGDKRQLYLEALRSYAENSVSAILASLNATGTPLARLEHALLTFAMRPLNEAELGCLGVSATCEFGQSDTQIKAINEAAGRRLLLALQQTVAQGIVDGEIATEVDAQVAAQFIMSIFSGIKVAARGGASTDSLCSIARMALRSLQ